MSYQVTNSRGSTVATVDDLTIDDGSCPLSLIGRGYAGYQTAMADNLFHLLENHANDTAPSPSPPSGMLWYDTTEDAEALRYYDGSTWLALATAANSSGVLLDRLAGCDNINLTVAASTNVHTGATDKKTFITGILLVPRTGASVSGSATPPLVSLEVSSSTNDCMDPVPLAGLTSVAKSFYQPVAGVQRIVQSGETVKFRVLSALDGAETLAVDLFLFGHVR